MKYLDRVRNGQSGTNSTKKSEQPYRTEVSKVSKVSKGAFATFDTTPPIGVQLFFEAPSLKRPSGQPGQDTTSNTPYRLNIDGRAQLLWLAPGLSPAEVLRQAKARYPDVEVTDRPPPHGWPRLADIPETPGDTSPQTFFGSKKESNEEMKFDAAVECWTPSGKRLMVTAQSPEHAEAIRRLNPITRACK